MEKIQGYKQDRYDIRPKQVFSEFNYKTVCFWLNSQHGVSEWQICEAYF